MGPWMQTRHGHAFDYEVAFDPRPEEVPAFDLRDIVWSLARQTRYLGHVAGSGYSVAEHSVLVSEAAAAAGLGPEYVRAALLHDATEAYLGDMPSPLKAFFPDFRHAEKTLARKLRTWAATRYGVAIAPFDAPEIVDLDRRILLDERAALFDGEVAPWEIEGPPLGVEIREWGAWFAASKYSFALRAAGLPVVGDP